MKRDKVVCECRRVNVGMILDAVDNGARSFEEVKAATGSGKGCKACKEYIERIIEDYLREES